MQDKVVVCIMWYTLNELNHFLRIPVGGNVPDDFYFCPCVLLVRLLSAERQRLPVRRLDAPEDIDNVHGVPETVHRLRTPPHRGGDVPV